MNSDKKLAGRIARGDTQAFATLVDTYGARVQRLVRRYARSEVDAEDLTQEIFVDLYRGIGGFRGASSLATWVYRVALNHCLKHVERRRPDSLPYDDALRAQFDETANPARHAARSELGSQVQSALGDLTPEHRDVVVLHELQELTYRECADILQIPIGTVKSRLSYAFRRLRTSLGGYVLGDDCDAFAGRPPVPETLS